MPSPSRELETGFGLQTSGSDKNGFLILLILPLSLSMWPRPKSLPGLGTYKPLFHLQHGLSNPTTRSAGEALCFLLPAKFFRAYKHSWGKGTE